MIIVEEYKEFTERWTKKTRDEKSCHLIALDSFITHFTCIPK